MALQDYRVDIDGCAKCGSCRIIFDDPSGPLGRPRCPSGAKYVFDSYYAAGRMEIARGLLDGLIEWTDRLIDRVFTCTGCRACDICYDASMGRPHEVIMEMKREMAKRGIIHPKHKKVTQSLIEVHNPFNQPHEDKFKWLGKDVPSGGKVMYFVGCQSAYARRRIAKATMKLLDSAGVEFSVLPEEWCCGYPLLHNGQEDDAVGIVEHNMEVMEKEGIETVLCSCSGCYTVLKHEYPEILGRKLPFNLMHTSEYLARLIKDGDLKLENPVPEVVTYHDPCTLGRHNDIYDVPRELLQSIPGLKLVEMERNRDDAWCCGTGGEVSFAFPDLSNWSSLQRMEEAEETGASILASACPGCATSFMSASSVFDKKGIKVCDINELLEKALG